MIAHTPVALKWPTAMIVDLIGDMFVDMIVVVVGGAGDADWAHLRHDTTRHDTTRHDTREVARVRRGKFMPATVRRMRRGELALVAAGAIVGTLVMSSAGTALANYC
jgi:hypothetical protein